MPPWFWEFYRAGVSPLPQSRGFLPFLPSQLVSITMPLLIFHLIALRFVKSFITDECIQPCSSFLSWLLIWCLPLWLLNLSQHWIQDLKKKEKELQAKEAELRRREQVYVNGKSNLLMWYCICLLLLFVNC